jgi:lipopolysaccharide export system protein LptA
VSAARAAFALVLALGAAQARADEPKPPPAPASSIDRLGLRFTRDAELIITSDEAEGLKAPGGRESVVFTKHVKAHQGDMKLECDWLEAVYPQAAAGRPDKISAKGSVVIVQGTNEARCSEAHIDNVACTAECRSEGAKATLHRGTDDVEADTIYFDLCKGTVKAVGSVQIRVREKPGESVPVGPAAAPLQPGAPQAVPEKANGG